MNPLLQVVTIIIFLTNQIGFALDNQIYDLFADGDTALIDLPNTNPSSNTNPSTWSILTNSTATAASINIHRCDIQRITLNQHTDPDWNTPFITNRDRWKLDNFTRSSFLDKYSNQYIS